MIRADEDALICDFAETYQIYDYKRLPVQLVAVLAVGLRDNSRIKMKLSGIHVAPDMLLMTTIVDQLNLLLWTKTKDAAKGRNRPKSILGNFAKSNNAESSFETGEDFEKARNKILKKIKERRHEPIE